MSPTPRAADATWARALLWPLIAILLGGTAFVALHDWLGLGGTGLDSAAEGWVYDSVVLAAGLACLVRASQVERERGAWLAIGAAVLCWAAAEIYWTAAILDDPSAPYPSLADAGYLLYYPLAATGLVLLIRARAHELDWRLWVDGLIAGLGTAALGATFVFDFVAEQAERHPRPGGDDARLPARRHRHAGAGRRRHLPHPLAPRPHLVAAARRPRCPRHRRRRLHAADERSAACPSGNWIDPIYLIGAVFLGAEAWLHRVSAIPASARFDGWRELMVPILFAAVMIGLFSTQYFTATSVLSTALWTATMIAVLVRLGMSVKENKRLLEQVRTDPLTGLGNRGRMQVDLETQCARATEEEPARLLLFDLNGFKRYNDTFGHPAGDDLLVRLGRSLKAAVGEDGSAYRIGGDEFCVLLSCPEERFEAVTAVAAAAMNDKGKGYEVAASWGAVEIPTEATDPAEAMQLADVRMYAQKESSLTDRRATVRGSGSRLGEALEQG